MDKNNNQEKELKKCASCRRNKEFTEFKNNNIKTCRDCLTLAFERYKMYKEKNIVRKSTYVKKEKVIEHCNVCNLCYNSAFKDRHLKSLLHKLKQEKLDKIEEEKKDIIINDLPSSNEVLTDILQK